MIKQHLSVNKVAWRLVEKLVANASEYGVSVKKTKNGTTIIDAGIEAKGGFQAGKIVTEICLGGLGKVKVLHMYLDDLNLPSIFVYTDHPAVATFGSQFAGWQIKIGGYNAIGSGPARALAKKPCEIYEKIDYVDKADVATLVLETSEIPPETVIKQIQKECPVKPENLAITLVSTTSIAGSMQVSGRIIETGMLKLLKLGFDPKLVNHAWGHAPVAPVHPKLAYAMGRTNDAILYTGVVYLTVSCDDDEMLKKIVEKAPSCVSPSYGQPFFEIFKKTGYNFDKVDSNLFAPAALVVNNVKTGKVFKAGKINVDAFKRSIGF